jgi:hypothetical protein
MIKFSDLVPDHNPARPVVYVFALDVSGSLSDSKESEVEDDDKELFSRKLEADGLTENLANIGAVVERCGMRTASTKWDLARAQICYYLHNIEGGAEVGLWKFGNAPELISDARSELFEPNRGPTEEGGRKRLIEKLMAPGVSPPRGSEDYRWTNFEALFKRLYEEYGRGPDYRNRDLRFVVVSDFLHHVEGQNPSSLAMNRESIEKKLSSLRDRGNISFHAVVIGAHESDNRFILPSMKKIMRPNQFVVDSLERLPGDPMPDFLFGSVVAERDLVFRYPKDDPESVKPIQLVWDEAMSEEDGRFVVVGLKTAAYKPSDKDLAIRVSLGRDGSSCQSAKEESDYSQKEVPESSVVLHPDERHKFDIPRVKDWLCVQPLYAEGSRVYSYQMTFSCESDRAGHKVHMVNVKMQKCMPRSASWIIIACLFSICSALMLCAIVVLRSSVSRRRARGASIVSPVKSLDSGE